MQLRDYQTASIDHVLAQLTAKRTILVLPTGAGKTVVAAEIVKRSALRTLWLAHRRELIDQAAGALDCLRLPTGIILAGREQTPSAPVQVASVQTLAHRDMPRADLVVVDEVHHATGPSYQNVLDAYKDAAWLGLTATPFRLDGKGLRDAGFDDIFVGSRPAELCARRTLLEPTVYAPDMPSMEGVKVRAGDYAIGEAAAVMSAPKLVGNIVATWRAKAEGRRTVVFAVNVEHSMMIAARFNDDGIACEHLDGMTPKPERSAILARLASGETTVLCNCMVLTEGWDLPALEVAVIARPTASLNLHLQMIGRIMRSCEDKAGAIVLDHAGNHHRHGMVTDHLEYSLDSKPVKAKGTPPTKTCPGCAQVILASYRACPECGYVFRGAEDDIPEEAAGELVEIAGPSSEPFQARALYYGKMLSIAYRKGITPPTAMAAAAYRKRYGEYPLVTANRLVDPSSVRAEDLKDMQAEWYQRGYELAERKNKDDPDGFARWIVRKEMATLRRQMAAARSAD